MQVIEYPAAAEFLEHTRDLLLENETANAILLSYAENQVRGIESAMSTKFYAVVEDDQAVLPAMFTAELWPLLGIGSAEAAQILARYFYSTQPTITGATGPKDISLVFADEWERLTHCDLEIQAETRLYGCSEIANIDFADGDARQATLDDFELVKKWRIAFRNDANTSLGASDSIIASHIKRGNYYLWVTDQPVSMAVYSRETESTGTIGVVYTPSEFRNRGYATALTAAVTRTILDSGKELATLHTNLDNPTSNSIYQKLGYKPIIDSTLWRFRPAI